MNMDEEKGTSAVQQYVKEWRTSRDWIKRYTDDFPELETLVDAVSLTSSSKAPLVGDITLAAAVRQIPRQSVQQLPVMSFEVNGTKRSVKAHLLSWVVRRIVFNKDTFGTGVLSRVQLAAESAFTHGFQMTMASFGTNPHDYGVNMQLVHHADFAVERGVLDFADSGFYDFRSRIPVSRAKAILKKAKKNKSTTWVVKELEELVKAGPNGDSDYANETSELRSEQAAHDAEGTYTWITRYGVGPYYSVDVFDEHTGKHLRKAKSNSKFGYPRMQGLVIDPAQLTPFGVSRVRLASAPANYANIYQQSTARMLLINADPPTFERGEFIGTPAMKRRARIRSNDPQAEFRVMELGNSTLTQYRQVLEHTGNQVLNVMGVTAGSAGLGADSNYSKTAAGVRMEQGVRDLTANQITNIIESHLRQFALAATDLWVSEQARVDEAVEVVVDDECKDAINQLGESKFEPEPVTDQMGQPIIDEMTGMPKMTEYEPLIGDDNILEVNWKELYDSIKTWTAEIDLSMGKDQMDEKKRADLQDLHTVISQTANPNDPNDQAMKSTLTKELLETALPDTAALASNKSQAMQGMPSQAPEAQQMEQPQ